MDDRLLPIFRDVESRHWWFRARRRLLIQILADRVPAGARLLDVGCGTGFFLEAAATRYAVQGLDPSSVAVTYCHQRGLLNVVEGTAERLPGEDAGGPFDVVCLLDVIEHLDDDVAAVREAARVTRPGGRLLLTVPAHQWLWSPHDEINHHRRRYSRAGLVGALSAAGWANIEAAHFNFLLLPLAMAGIAAERLRRGPLRARLAVPPAPLNRLLEGIFSAEGYLLRGARIRGFPFGLSLVATAVRPAVTAS